MIIYKTICIFFLISFLAQSHEDSLDLLGKNNQKNLVKMEDCFKNLDPNSSKNSPECQKLSKDIIKTFSILSKELASGNSKEALSKDEIGELKSLENCFSKVNIEKPAMGKECEEKLIQMADKVYNEALELCMKSIPSPKNKEICKDKLGEGSPKSSKKLKSIQ